MPPWPLRTSVWRRLNMSPSGCQSMPPVHADCHRIVSALRCRLPDRQRQKQATTHDVVVERARFRFNLPSPDTFREIAKFREQGELMKQPSVYLKMRVLGAVDTVAGRTRHERIHHVAAMTFLDEEGNPRQFTW